MALVYAHDWFPPEVRARLEALHTVVTARAIDAEAVRPHWPELEGLVTLLDNPITDSVLEQLPKVRVIASMAVGYDNIDVAACGRRGIVVTNTPGVLDEATADLAFGLVLAASRRIAEGDRLVRARGWHEWRPDFMVGQKVSGRTIGILGMGRIGLAVARRARGFGMNVLYTSRRRAPLHEESAVEAVWRPLDRLFAESDVVSVHCPLTAETRRIASRELLFSMKPGAVFVNTSRGGCVDEVALCDALESGHLFAAGLDVYDDEPHVQPRLVAMSNVVLAPHIGSAEQETRLAMANLAADNALAVLAGRPALTPVG